jgi:hypothetical protein
MTLFQNIAYGEWIILSKRMLTIVCCYPCLYQQHRVSTFRLYSYNDTKTQNHHRSLGAMVARWFSVAQLFHQRLRVRSPWTSLSSVFYASVLCGGEWASTRFVLAFSCATPLFLSFVWYSETYDANISKGEVTDIYPWWSLMVKCCCFRVTEVEFWLAINTSRNQQG